MPTYQPHYPTVNIPNSPAHQLEGELVLPSNTSVSPSSSTDGAFLLGAARSRMLEEKVNAEMARARVELLYELRCQQQEQVISRATRIMAKIRENADNPLLVEGLQASFVDWLAESRAVIRHAVERGW